MTGLQAVELFFGILAGVGGVLALVFGGLYAFGLRQRAQIAADGLVRRSGTRWVRVVRRNYRGPGLVTVYRSSGNVGEVLLTSRGLYVVGGALVFTPEELGRCTAKLVGDALELATDRPPNATGRVEVVVRVEDGAGWLAALTERGVAVG